MWIVAGVAGLLVGFVLGAVLIGRAPDGYEDETGFHLGRDPRTEDQARKLAAMRLGITGREIREIENRREWAEQG